MSQYTTPDGADALVRFLHDRGGQPIALSELPAQLRDSDMLTVADGHDLIEFGRRKHCYAGDKLVLEDGWEWTHVTGPGRNSMPAMLAEDEQAQTELRLQVRLTAKGRLRAAELRLQPTSIPNNPPGDRQSPTVLEAEVGEHEQLRDKIPLRAKKAWGQYCSAAEAMGEQTPKDADAYKWLKRAFERAREADELPDYGTWSRYLREYRKLTHQQKHHPRRDRSGRSIHRRSQL